MKPALSPESILSAAVERLTSQYRAKGDLELYFVRQIAGYQITLESLQRNMDRLCSSAELDDTKIDRLTRSQARIQRMEIVAIKELKDLQQRRNLIERFPDQTRDCPPLGDHFCHIGEHPIVKPIPPMHRGRLYPPTDHRPMRYSTAAEGNIKRLVPDEAAALSA